MIAETAMCPASNHHEVGWWLWLQAGLSGLVLLSAVGLLAADHSARRRAAARG